MMADEVYAGGAEPAEGQSLAERAGTLEHEIEDIRANLDRLLGDLDRRRHEAFDLRLQWRRHKMAISVGAAVTLALAASSIALAVRRRHKRARLSDRVRRFSRALSRIADGPERVVGAQQTVWGRILAAGGGAAAAVVARQAAERVWRR